MAIPFVRDATGWYGIVYPNGGDCAETGCALGSHAANWLHAARHPSSVRGNRWYGVAGAMRSQIP
jgi:hypothetical protein